MNEQTTMKAVLRELRMLLRDQDHIVDIRRGMRYFNSLWILLHLTAAVSLCYAAYVSHSKVAISISMIMLFALGLFDQRLVTADWKRSQKERTTGKGRSDGNS